MKEELQNTLLESIDLVKEWAQKGGEFVAEQTPLVIQELLLYNFWWHLIWWTIGVIGLLALCYTFKCGLKWVKKTHEEAVEFNKNIKYSYDKKSEDVTGEFMFVIIAHLTGLSIVLPMIICNFTWLKIWLAPRLYILEYVGELASKL